MPSDPRPPVRVFISAKSADYDTAASIYHRLIQAGIAAFFSRESLPELGSADYRREIDAALDQTEHMVVVTSSPENALSSWVEAEWGFFINEKRSGRKRGNLVTVVLGGLRPAELPPSLRYYEVIPFDAGCVDRLLRYVHAAGAEHTMDRPAEKRVSAAGSAFRERSTFGGPPPVNVMRICPGRALIATGGVDGAIRVYDATTQMRQAVLGSARYWMARHEGLITALEFSPDGGRLASGHLDGSIHVWNVATETEVGTPTAHDLAISGLAFSSDGKAFTAAGKDGVLKRWSLAALENGEPAPALQRAPAPIVSMIALPARSWLVAGLINMATRRYVIQILDDDGHAALATLALSEEFVALTVSDDGRLLAAGGRDGAVRLYDLAAIGQAISQNKSPRTFPLLAEVAVHAKPVKAMAFFPDASRVLTCAMDGKLSIVDTASAKIAGRLQAGTDERFAAVAILPDTMTVVAALADGRLRCWDR